MLLRLHISNYAIIDEAVIEPDKGLTVISGETGAGKSILLGLWAWYWAKGPIPVFCAAMTGNVW